MIPISIIILTKNNASTLERTLQSCTAFDDVTVIDSASNDGTRTIARKHNRRIIDYVWDGQYPKKKQWAIDNAAIKYPWVFLLDADEELTNEFIKDISQKITEPACIIHQITGYFVRGHNIIQGQKLRHGLSNNKLCLFKKDHFHFPEVNDLSCNCLSEVEGHYQPIPNHSDAKIGQVDAAILHHVQHDLAYYRARHADYAKWEAHMTHHNAWPVDPIPWRERAKKVLRTNPLRPIITFIYAYVVKCGFLDGRIGLHHALDRYHYAASILRALKRTP